MDEVEPLRVQPIKNGTVIDHIPPGKSLKVLDILGLYTHDPEEETTLSVLSRVPSESGTKDIIKIENRELIEDEINKIYFIAPNATVNIIENFKVKKKLPIDIPDTLENLMRCPNIGDGGCISNALTAIGRPERVDYIMKVVDKNPLTVQCFYCARTYSEEKYDLQDFIIFEPLGL